MKFPVFLVDAPAIIYQHFYRMHIPQHGAINLRKVQQQQPIIVKSDEENAIILAQDVAKWFHEKVSFNKSVYGGLVFDTRGASTYRQGLIDKHVEKMNAGITNESHKTVLPPYKGIRTPNNVVFLAIKHLREFHHPKLNVIECEKAEADDVIAILAHKLLSVLPPQQKILIASPDKDLLQLLQSERISLRRKEFDHYVNRQTFILRCGLSPAQHVDSLALTGDVVDNIGGLSGVGETTARQLLLRFGSLEEIIKACEENRLINSEDKVRNVDVKLQAKILENKDTLLLGKSLIRLRGLDSLPLEKIYRMKSSVLYDDDQSKKTTVVEPQFMERVFLNDANLLQELELL